jgi:hypothetical protein
MKKNLDDNSKTWLADRKLKKILKIDDFKVSELILNFDLLAYDIDGEIRHFHDDGHSELAFEIGSLKFKRREVDEFIKNYPDFGKSEPGKPASYRWRLENELENIIYLEQNRKQQGVPSSSHLKSEKRRIKEEIKESEPAASGEKQTKRPRTKVAEQIYIAAASRAWVFLWGQIHACLLPESATRKEKLEMLKADKDFQRIIKGLKRCPGDEYLIRKLGEAKIGLWKMGRTDNKKYRRKSM